MHLGAATSSYHDSILTSTHLDAREPSRVVRWFAVF